MRVLVLIATTIVVLLSQYSRVAAQNHDDASTGTVTELTEDQVKKSRAAMTCDSIMAKSLVLANEDKREAEKDRDYFKDKFEKAVDQINQLTETLETTNKELGDKIHNLTALLDHTNTQAETAMRNTEHQADKKIADHAQLTAKQIKALQQTITDVKAEAADDMLKAEAKWFSLKEGLEREIQQAIDDGAANLTSAQNKFAADIHALKLQLNNEKEAGAKALQQAEDRHNNDREKLVLSNNNQLASAEQTAAQKVAQAQNDRDEKIAQAQQISRDTVAKANKDRDDRVAAIQAEMEALKIATAQKIQTIKEATAKAVETLKDDHQQKQKEKEQEIEHIKNKALQEKTALLQDHDTKAKQLIAEKETTKLTLEEQHQNTVTQLKSEMDTKEKKAIDDLKAKELDMERKLKMMKQDSERQLSGLTDNHGKERNNLKNSINEMEKSIEKMNQEIQIMENKYDDARKEIQSWEDLHSSRSYCNLTHLHEDTSAAVTVASKAASQHLAVGAAYVAKVSEPHLKKGQELYDIHLKEHVDKHYTPVHESHVAPLVATAQTAIVKMINSIKDFLSFVHAKLAAGLERSCPTFQKTLNKVHLYTVHDFVQKECKDPAVAVNKVLWLYLALFVLLFRDFLWRATKAIIYFPFKVMWYLTPLPFLFGKKKKVGDEDAKTRPNSDANGIVKSEPDGNGAKASKILIKEEQ